jgi:hypothetical protein
MVLPILLELAPRYGIRAMRLSREGVGAALRFDRRHAARKIAEGAVFHALAAYAAPRLRARRCRRGGTASTGCTRRPRRRGVPAGGHRGAPGSVSEVYCHPSDGVAPALAAYQPGYDHGGEVAALVSPRVRAAVDAAGVELVAYPTVGG